MLYITLPIKFCFREQLWHHLKRLQGSFFPNSHTWSQSQYYFLGNVLETSLKQKTCEAGMLFGLEEMAKRVTGATELIVETLGLQGMRKACMYWKILAQPSWRPWARWTCRNCCGQSKFLLVILHVWMSWWTECLKSRLNYFVYISIYIVTELLNAVFKIIKNDTIDMTFVDTEWYIPTISQGSRKM